MKAAEIKRYSRVWPGCPDPLGATWDGFGVNFAVYSQHAERIELCLFSGADAVREHSRIELPAKTGHVWHAYLPDVQPGLVYGYRVYGPFKPEEGHRFNSNKVLLDPYAKRLARDLSWGKAMFAYQLQDHEKYDCSFSDGDNAALAPLASVIDTAFTWGDDKPPRTPWHKTLIYEVNVKGMTMSHPELPPSLRGTFSGLGSEPIISHLKSLGVTAVELLPVFHAVQDWHLVNKGLGNYWGYNTLAYFAPDSRFASSPETLPVDVEFKQMVRNFHAAKIEVILDVVYNHTGEGNQMGPTVSFRGFDNRAYYRMVADNPRYYQDFTGCGNTLNTQNPQVLKFICDSLRYWVEEMHVDGFRFDLASTLAREGHGVDMGSGFLDILHQEPVLSRVKLIAEPWDLGEGGYQVGGFPVLWSEWNDKYRAAVRSYWRGDAGTLGGLATRISGSSDLFQGSGRTPQASINFVTSHDGFTLRDLVSYNEKHNRDNGEGNRDGENHNLSWNCGVEGATSKRAINELRLRQRKNMIATLFLSAGVPMLLGGDELGRTQKGNNNAYCQDNRISWFSWKLKEEDEEFLSFVKFLSALRRIEPVLQRRFFYRGAVCPGTKRKDIYWINAEGKEMDHSAWHSPLEKALGVCLNGEALADLSEKGRRLVGNTLLLMFNATSSDVSFVFPQQLVGSLWELLFDTALLPSVQEKKLSRLKKTYELKAHSFAAFRLLDLPLKKGKAS